MSPAQGAGRNAAPRDDSALSGTACPRCGGAMHAISLASNTGRAIGLDHCRDCRLVWFDAWESVRLDQRSWARLLREMQRDREQPPAYVDSERSSACPVCRAPLRQSHNATRFGRFTVQTCPHGHGSLHSDVALLSERGLVRPPGVAERKALAQERHPLACLNCGAPVSPSIRDDACRYCTTPLLVLDLPRLAHSLAPREVAIDASPADRGAAAAWSCRACGHTLDPARETHCPSCAHAVVALGMPDLGPLLDAAEARLDRHAAKLAQLAGDRRALRGDGHGVAAAPPALRSSWITSRPGALGEARWMLGGWAPLWAALAAALLIAAIG